MGDQRLAEKHILRRMINLNQSFQFNMFPEDSCPLSELSQDVRNLI